jgi:hypothetical protein
VLRSEGEHQHIENAKVHDRSESADGHEFQEPPEFFAVLLRQGNNLRHYFSPVIQTFEVSETSENPIFNTVNTPNSAPSNKWVLLTYRLSNT